ncbi:FTR1 family protein [Herbaspirillum sp. WKF16]|uniref:FTR1 family iron permease n=1 Tax=Herbaspirillum sp. WKF16 TaxID=3028312 RepID=UPI0023A97E21|nr:FTR1 family protein [Herbaspirillum sp. WKF16]WDZ95801.1 FTR1 family protein [Herbaspirillum sp. WKF16]
MGQTSFIVWRESVEALLIVGILFSWMKNGGERTRYAVPYLWGGVALGILAAVLAGYMLVAFNDALDGNAQTYFQIVIVLTAAALIVRMAFWMRKNGRTMKADLLASLDHQSTRKTGWGVLFLAALAITREGSECAVFLYGVGVGHAGSSSTFISAVVIGLACAIATFMALQLGGKLISWRRFFQVSELILFFLAAGLLLTGLEKCIDLVLENTDFMSGLPLVDVLTTRAWDTRWLLDDGTVVGGMVSTMTGYRSQPVYMSIAIYCTYWAAIAVAIRRGRQAPAAQMRSRG